ncbi:MAG: transporter [Bacteroides sp.]|nr:transporter [Bacteroides sp.]
MLKFIKNWTLPLAMLVGALGYLVLSRLSFVAPFKPIVNEGIAWFTPFLIFAQLLLTFCKVEPKELLPKAWHWWLLSFQTVSCGVLAWVLLVCPMSEAYRSVVAGAMVCLICPTATAAAVITGKLGGSASTLTTYTLLSNLLAAVAVPLVFPLVEPHEGLGFVAAFFKILGKVFPLLLSPFFVALLLRYVFPKIHRALLTYHGVAFYLWAIALAIVTGQTVRSLVNSTADVSVEVMVAMAGLAACAVQFFLGKNIGGMYADRISAGQALGQKNTVLAIWMAFTYLNPLSSVAPGSYVIWQNLFNSWQLWKRRKKQG